MKAKEQTLVEHDLAGKKLEDLPVADADADQTAGGSGPGKREIEVSSWSFSTSVPSEIP